MLRETSYPSELNGSYPINVLYGFVLDSEISYLLILSPAVVRGTQITGLSTRVRGNFFNSLLKQRPDEFFSENVKVLQIIEDDFDRFYGREWTMNDWDTSIYIENERCNFFIEKLNLQTLDDSNQRKIQEFLGK